jgi:hypothetical protein
MRPQSACPPDHRGLIDDFLAAFASQSRPSIDEFLRAHREDLRSRETELRAEARSLGLGSPFDSVMMGGDCLHLSSGYREEQVSDWLRWVLEAPPLSANARTQLVRDLLSRLLAEPTYVKFAASGRRDPKLDERWKAERVEREYVLSTGQRLDLVLWPTPPSRPLVIEIKTGNLKIDKNRDYRRALLERPEFRDPVTMLVIPSTDLDALLAPEDDGPSTEVLESLQAFPPVSWESLLRALRVSVSALLARASPAELDEAKAYATMVAGFISFVEAHVLDYPLRLLRKVIEGASGTHELAALDDYLAYRRG